MSIYVDSKLAYTNSTKADHESERNTAGLGGAVGSAISFSILIFGASFTCKNDIAYNFSTNKDVEEGIFIEMWTKKKPPLQLLY